MASQHTGSFHMMKSLNRSLILNTIRQNGAISRSEIAKATKLTPPTVTNLVNELLEENLVYESSAGESKGGRKPILLKIKSDSRFIIGIDIGVRKMRIALSDMDARLLKQELIPMPGSLTKTTFLEFLQHHVGTFMRSIDERREKLIGIGAAMHGIVDHRTGNSIHAPTLGIRNIPVKEALEEVSGLPVRVENDAKAMALGEKWFGAGRNVDSFLCLNIGEGIGAGLVIDNTLFHGHNSLAGEIGHMMIEKDGPVCSCGRSGCLQTFASGEAMRRRMKAKLETGAASSLKAADSPDGAAIFEAAEKGDELSREVLSETGDYLGTGLVNAVHFINPPLIILGGGVAKAGKYLLPSIKKVMKDRALSEEAGETEVEVSYLGEEGSLIGACTLILAELFEIPD
ncbi:ROK family transcriptional regulator [Alkalicoccus halolimnae]|uniref:ROK family transcriptional regulator n=1 Tax=Alkalicoccus halolimnae TaxID=1667239 RepID=A0A5C7F1X2_9BACI|nr:ROK family transcriptional regulator [Alkalicoccus halolimnae]TXF83928.1 ROK family transcriptional regulator [Alkalicoccus halolimnae]